jgi:hypothetical protein
MRILPFMTEHQQRVYCALALLEEADLKAFFRAIRDLRDSRPEVELVNIELDHGVGLMDLFGPMGPFAQHMSNNLLEFDVVRLGSGRWSIAFGFRGPDGWGGHWVMDIGADGAIDDLEGGLCWMPRRWKKRVR